MEYSDKRLNLDYDQNGDLHDEPFTRGAEGKIAARE